VSGDCLAKAVVLRRKDGYLLAVLPASAQVQLDAVGRWLGQPVGLAAEDEIGALFPDCEQGAVPPVAAAYAMQGLIDESLEGKRDIYFEGGDHRTLVHVSGDQFHRLMQDVPHARFCLRSGAQRPDPHYSGA
jgi:Ala-tRNA(Pro) deacylase